MIHAALARRLSSLLAVAAALAGAPAHGQAQGQVAFPVHFDRSADTLTATERMQLSTHLEAAGRRWTSLLAFEGVRVIEIEVALSETIPRATGHSLASVYVGMDAGRMTFEQGAAHELRTGADQNGLEPDVRITFNAAYLRDELWFDPEPGLRTASVPATRTDAMSVLLHEFGHALAYNGWASGQGVAPGGYWSTFDRWMLAGAPALFDGPESVAALGFRPDLTVGNLHHWANPDNALGKSGSRPVDVAWLDGAPRPASTCDGPASLDAPTSVDAPGKAGVADDLLFELMNGVVFYRGTRYDVSALDRATLIDAGLPVDTTPVFGNGFER